MYGNSGEGSAGGVSSCAIRKRGKDLGEKVSFDTPGKETRMMSLPAGPPSCLSLIYIIINPKPK
ncbi:hypothetical protein [Methanogenium sp. MK-MG]|uniref:hypothetical protein n=1 Tax=Methanogenium sp. MK-MG TaxID=2599926 RepID=UPI0013EC5F43|nr:hypothetical protein [Methanogenium sp. MK-MG]KAF1078754.1 hypothetical protein MKMG_00304 [Methanogenium sp. MK-MG]